MPKPKINDRQLLRLLDKEGKTQAEAAREIGVSPQAVNQRLQELRGKTTRVIASKKAEVVIEERLDSIAQLNNINDKANDLLDELEKNPALKIRCMAEIRGQLELQLKIFQTLYSIQEAKAFQETVLEVIGEVDPNVRKTIIERLNQKRTIRQSVKLY